MTKRGAGIGKDMPRSRRTPDPVHEGATDREKWPPVGRVLRRAREHRELSLRDVERRIGRSNAYLSQVERGLIRQPDPSVLLELAELYGLDFMTLATWAGWTNSDGSERDPGRADSASLLMRRVLSLDETQRTQVLRYIKEILREPET